MLRLYIYMYTWAAGPILRACAPILPGSAVVFINEWMAKKKLKVAICGALTSSIHTK